MDLIIKRLIEELSLKEQHVVNTVKLIDEGNTIPFIARYRKEVTGEMDDQVLRRLADRLAYLRSMEEKKSDIKRHIQEQDKLTDELEKAIDNAQTLQELDDIYRPYRPKRRTRATIAKEKGLEPLADLLYAQTLKEGDIDSIAAPYINPEKEVNTTEDALAGAMDIIAEGISDNADYRKAIRQLTAKNGVVIVKGIKEDDSVYAMYYDFKEPVLKIASHRVLAVNRGEREGFLNVGISTDTEAILQYIYAQTLARPSSITTEYVRLAGEDAYNRLISPSIEREIRNNLTDEAEEKAMVLFAKNLRQLLLQPPIKSKVVLGLDPGYRTGCKVAVVDDTGKVLDVGVVYCTLEHHDISKAKATIKALINKHDVNLIAIGNGTASKETEIFASELIKEQSKEIYYIMVNEAGASVYSASKLGAEEFPEFDVSLRSAVSIARRLQDPLAELVKIDPKSIGVGQYQHDMNQKRLGETLGGVVEDCVNSVGVDLNTASAPLLSHIAGINASVAKNIVSYREENGSFNNRSQLKKVSKLGDKAFLQCAGFLRIPGGKNVLDNTSVHPESYALAGELLERCGYKKEDVLKGNIADLEQRASKLNLKELAESFGAGLPTVMDIIKELLKPGRDMREDLPMPVLRTDIMSIESLQPGMILTGTVRNLTDFGAFVDIGVHQDGLVHISQISDKFIRHPMDVLSIGDIVKVKVLDVNISKSRIGLGIKGI